jgi:GNAT superfamily N-acetyltransferase
MGLTVRRLQSREFSAASSLLARAFAGDPFIGHFFADQRRRQLALPPFFRAVLHQLADSQALFAGEVEGRLIGLAAWVPPEPAVASRRSVWLARAALLELRILFPRATLRVLDGFETLGQRHPAMPHWYLAFVGIEPAQQGRGLGRALLAPVLKRADEAGVDCYLETPFPDTRPFYERLGFNDTDELRPVAGAPPIWTMTRPARPATAPSR